MSETSDSPVVSTSPETPPSRAFRARLEARNGVSGISCCICEAWAPGLLVQAVVHAESCTLVGERPVEALQQDLAEKQRDSVPTKRVALRPRLPRKKAS